MGTENILNRKSALLLLVSEDDVKTHTPMSANKAKGTLVAHIQAAQLINIRKALGKTLYKNLLAEWEKHNLVADELPDGTPSGNPPIITDDETNYQELYKDYIFNALCWWSYVLSLPTTSMNVGEQGILLRHTDNSENAGIEGLEKLVANGESIARTYTQELIDYIAELSCNNETLETESKDVGGASADIFVPKKRWHGKKGSKF